MPLLPRHHRPCAGDPDGLRRSALRIVMAGTNPGSRPATAMTGRLHPVAPPTPSHMGEGKALHRARGPGSTLRFARDDASTVPASRRLAREIAAIGRHGDAAVADEGGERLLDPRLDA